MSYVLVLSCNNLIRNILPDLIIIAFLSYLTILPDLVII